MKKEKLMPFLMIGDIVKTSKGGRFRTEGPFEGMVVSFNKWRGYDAATVLKKGKSGRGSKVQCLIKNLVLVKRNNPSSSTPT